jgi:hypothetical protein
VRKTLRTSRGSRYPAIVKLAALRIADPCPEDWHAMTGDARARWCARCALTVTAVAELRLAETEALLAQRDARVCVRAVADADGNVITRTTHEARFVQALRALAGRAGGRDAT